jgi:hypothetical protein
LQRGERDGDRGHINESAREIADVVKRARERHRRRTHNRTELGSVGGGGRRRQSDGGRLGATRREAEFLRLSRRDILHMCEVFLKNKNKSK